jgi:hypothetical protein
MRIWSVTFAIATVLLSSMHSDAQSLIIRGSGNATNGVLLNTNRGTAINPQSMAPNLAMSNATPAIAPQGIAPAMPTPGAPAITPQGAGVSQGFTTGIGPQGSTTIGPQGNTAIGQQGSGTAIGQQGIGTAITPQSNANAIVIGQPEPFTPQPSAPAGVGSNLLNPSVIVTNQLGQPMQQVSATVSNAPRNMVTPNPTVPMSRVPGKR